LAALYLLLTLWQLWALRKAVPAADEPCEAEAEESRWRRAALLCLFFLLLPQALMFHTRVLFLLAPVSEGGLGCSLQWIGMAQGTVGIIAFSLGLGLGRRWERKTKVFSSIPFAHVTLLLSPFVYYAMTLWPPQTLPMLCVATFVAQFTFGLGLNACIPYIRAVSGERYSSTVNYIYIPAVALVMLLPMAISGGLAEYLGFRAFFTLDAFMAVPALIAGRLSRLPQKGMDN
jgi:PAT family beta-lactamase induction signal transducer AmpG